MVIWKKHSVNPLMLFFTYIISTTIDTSETLKLKSWGVRQFGFICLLFKHERLLYSTGKTWTCCKSAEKPPCRQVSRLVRSYGRHFFTCIFTHQWPYFTHYWPPCNFISPSGWNHLGLHTINPCSDSCYPNSFFRSPTLSTFQNTHIWTSRGPRIMVQVEGL